MTEQDKPTPEELLQIKAELTERWRKLPVEHQASMMVVLLKSVMDGEYGEWIHAAIEISRATEDAAPKSAFTVTREDVKQLRFSPEEIAQLSDDDLLKISRALEAHYRHDLFRDELRHGVEIALEEKQTSA